MNRTVAVFLLLGICILLVVLLLTETITSTVSGLVFATALLILGLLSRGFKQNTLTSKEQQ